LVVRALLANGADIDAKRIDGATALFVASQNGHHEVVRELLAKGADIQAKRIDGATALFMATQNAHMKVQALLAQALKRTNPSIAAETVRTVPNCSSRPLGRLH
jgi:ankyrin repeat protein